MSSSEFAVRLDVDRRCRLVVLASGSLFAVTGAVIVAGFNLAPPIRGLLLFAWILESLRELRNYAAGMRRLSGIRLGSSGRVLVTGPGGHAEDAVLETGTIVLGQFAWIRLRFADGVRHGELLVAGWTESHSWHRLHLLWRMCREAFGHPGAA